MPTPSPAPARLSYAQADDIIRRSTVEVSAVDPAVTPTISVGITTFNHARFLPAALESVLGQRLSFPLEIIIGDDCSTDGTTDVARAAQHRHPDRVRVLLARENLGRHTGNGRLNFLRILRACRGTFVACLDGDDYWTDPTKLQQQVGFLEAHPAYAGSAHQTQVIDEDGAPGKVYGQFDRPDLGVADTLAIDSPWHTSSFVFRRAWLELPEWFLRVVSADMALFTMMARRGPIWFIRAVMSVYRKHAAGLCATDAVAKAIREARIDLLDCLEPHLDPRYRDTVERLRASHRAALGHQPAPAARRTGLRARLARCFGHRPSGSPGPAGARGGN